MHGSLGPPSPQPKRNLDQFIHFCRTHACVQQRDTETHRPCYICSNRLHLCTLRMLCSLKISTLIHTHTYSFNGPFSRTTWVGQYQKGKTKLDFTEARNSEWQWHQLGHMQVCTSLQTDNHASTPPLSFLQAGCPSAQPTASKHRRQH